MPPKKQSPASDTVEQKQRFIEKARELECDEDESRFNETLKRIAPKKGEEPTNE